MKLMADYGCYPLWWESADKVGDIDPTTLPLSSDTIRGLEQWADTYDAKLNWDDPAASAFSHESKLAFESEGIRLWKQLQKELALNYEVVYFSYTLNKIITHDSELEALRLPSSKF